MNQTPIQRLHFVSSGTPEADASKAELEAMYGAVPADQADVIVALGGDGMMLQCLHQYMNTGIPLYGMNCGSVGFLMNDYRPHGLLERLNTAQDTRIHPLIVEATDKNGEFFKAHALNEASFLRQRHQAAKLRITIDGKVRMDELICDGIMVATPAGSTAYNLSAHGPILPIGSSLLALTPISPFRPRRWRGALLPNHARVEIEVLEADKRPVSTSADHLEFRNVIKVLVYEDTSSQCVIMFDHDHGWDERILAEMFKY
ncbi:NAD kinase [Pseudovibrio sp. SPO723]|uniref:NAD kinase n=1 Tax=Nesiotobacter zosterae TaxID=392721 RepID=UPI0029C38FAE|nr:NAD kinase [Pseudovibrio sp. SPO723]MDX5594596.1 NAD kinase [Pseudovibrio sp. SPO723]